MITILMLVILQAAIPFRFVLTERGAGGPEVSTITNFSVAQNKTTTVGLRLSLDEVPQEVKLSLDGFPAGTKVKASFKPSSCKKTCDMVMTIKADKDAVVGRYALTLTAKNKQHSAGIPIGLLVK